MLPSIPYKGSKSKIAVNIIDILPPAETFVDLFAGGGAMTTAAILSHKYKRYIMSDIEPGLTQLYVDAVNGKYHNEDRWISRGDFYRMKDDDAFVRFIWSFGSNGRSYLYGEKVEPLKMALHYASVWNDYSLLHALGITTPVSHKASKFDRYRELKLWMRKNVHRCDLESLESLERLERLQSLERLQMSYDKVNIPDNSTVYCDIPYKGTDKYGKSEFDHDRFFEWCRNMPFPVYISEYTAPDDFIPIWGKKVFCTMSATSNPCRRTEYVFVYKKWIGLYYKLTNRLF